MKKELFLIFCISMFLLSGCFPTAARNTASHTESSNKQESANTIGSVPDSIHKQLTTKLTVKADVIKADAKDLNIRSIHLKKFNVKQVKMALLNDQTVIKTYEIHNDLFPNSVGKDFQFSGGSLSVQLGSIRYQTDYYSKHEYSNVIFGTDYFIRPDLKNTYTKKNLENLNKQDAVEKVKNVLDEAGIHHLGNPDVIALDLKTLQSHWVDFKTKTGGHPPKWQKGDEAYIVIYPVVYDGLNLTTKGYLDASNRIPVTGSRIMGVVNKEGLIYFTCEGIYEPDQLVKSNVTPISLKAALEKVKNKYKNVILTDPVVISRIALEYVPVVSNSNSVQYKLVPAWVFTASQKTTLNKKGAQTKVSQDFSIFINAETGEEIRIGGKA